MKYFPFQCAINEGQRHLTVMNSRMKDQEDTIGEFCQRFRKGSISGIAFTTCMCWTCVFKHLAKLMISDQNIWHVWNRHFYHNYNTKFVAKLSSQLHVVTDATL
jgi:hypothetical protein